MPGRETAPGFFVRALRLKWTPRMLASAAKPARSSPKAARLLSPNLVDYFTKTLPPSPPFPSTPGKIPSSDNPYAPGAALEAATFFLPQRRIVAPLEIAARTLEESALKAASRAAKTAVGSQSLARAGVELVARP